VHDARSVAFLDTDEDVSGVDLLSFYNGPLNRSWQGTLDILIQRTGVEGQGKIMFVQNNFYYDAFFLKAIGEFYIGGLMYIQNTASAMRYSSQRSMRKWLVRDS
jgi:hypothetical protein